MDKYIQTWANIVKESVEEILKEEKIPYGDGMLHEGEPIKGKRNWFFGRENEDGSVKKEIEFTVKNDPSQSFEDDSGDIVTGIIKDHNYKNDSESIKKANALIREINDWRRAAEVRILEVGLKDEISEGEFLTPESEEDRAGKRASEMTIDV